MYAPKGFFEKADEEFRNDRDENLWIACLANSNQDAAVAKSNYIKIAAKEYKQIELERKARRIEQEQHDRETSELGKSWKSLSDFWKHQDPTR